MGILGAQGMDTLPDAQEVIRSGTDDEDNDHHDQSQAVSGHLAVFVLISDVSTARHLFSLFVRFLDCLDEFCVEERQTWQRNEETHEEIAQRLVNHDIIVIFPQLSLLGEWNGVVVGVQPVVYCSLPETWQVVEDREYENEYDGFTHAWHGWVLWCVQRSTDCHVPVGCDDHYQPHSARLCDGRHGPNERLHVGKVAPKRRAPIRERVYGFQCLQKDAQQEIDDVCEGKNLQQESCRSPHHVILPKNQNRDDIPGNTKNTEEEQDVDVQCDFEVDVSGWRLRDPCNSLHMVGWYAGLKAGSVIHIAFFSIRKLIQVIQSGEWSINGAYRRPALR